jgi:hypothetical protein
MGRNRVARCGRLFRNRTPCRPADFTLIALLVLAGLGTSARCAQAAVLADRAHAAPAHCPYHFGSDMPSATFCVYRGVGFGSGGEVCATDVVVIWSSASPQSPVSADRVEMASGSDRDVYLGFVADPELVLRAIVDPRQGDRAEMVGYTVGSGEAAQPLTGQTTLRTVRLKSSETANMLSMELREPRRLHPQGCAFASYSGTFMGVIGP